MNREKLRKKIRQQRRDLTPEQRWQKSELLAYNIAKSHVFHNSRRIACYMAMDGEIDLMPIMEIAWAMGKEVYLPVLSTPNNKLWFAKFHVNDKVVPNKYGILEPVMTKRKRISTRAIDLVITPLVAVDAQGNRVGMGGGYYDKSFAFLRNRQKWFKPRLMGAAYDFQCVDKLTPQAWDIPLHSIATESSLEQFFCLNHTK